MTVKYSGYRDGNGGLMQTLRVGMQGKTTVLDIGTTATHYQASSGIVRLVAQDVSACIKTENAVPTAATTDMLLPTSVVEYIVCDKGPYIGVVAATGGTGKLFITEAV
jgi:hypothetical protein